MLLAKEVLHPIHFDIDLGEQFFPRYGVGRQH
jgi:hypothetical protein